LGKERPLRWDEMAKGGLYGRPERGVLGCADVRFLPISQVVERMAVGYVVDENECSGYGSTEVASVRLRADQPRSGADDVVVNSWP
jgi:hypothetical protein